MRRFRYQIERFNTDSAHDLCLELGAALGVNLCVKDAERPNDVHGYLNTDGDGNVEIYLYDAEDVTAIGLTDGSKKTHVGIHKVHPISYAAAHIAATNVLTKWGLKP